jgi:hypothetical protein
VHVLRSYYNSGTRRNSLISTLEQAKQCQTEVIEGQAPPRIRTPPKPRARFLKSAEVLELVTLYQDGATIYTLGKRYGIHPTTVSDHLKRHGIARRGSGR